MARHHADDARPAGKLYPMDRHSPGRHPHHDARPQAHPERKLGGRPVRESGVENVEPGGDPTERLNRLYEYGRSYPHGRPHERPRHDLAVPEVIAPSHHEPAHYHQGGLGEHHISNTPSEEPPQFHDEKRAHDYCPDTSGWVRGMSDSPHPFFDSGLSGERYRRK